MNIGNAGLHNRRESGSESRGLRSHRPGRVGQCLLAVSLGGAFSLLSLPVSAESPVADFLSFYDEESTGNYFKADLEANMAWFAQGDSWAGNDVALLGAESDSWGEYGIKLGFEGMLSLGDYGGLFARVSGVYTTTRHGLDAGGSNINAAGTEDVNANYTTVEDVNVRWKSGSMFPELGEDALQVSLGSQRYQVGSGFLISDGGGDGGDRGGFWLGMRIAFEKSAIVSLTTGNWHVEAAYLQPDLPGEETDVASLNVEYSFGDRADIAFNYIDVFDSESVRRDGLDIYSLRGSTQPIERWPGLRIDGEIAQEDNGDLNDSLGGYLRFAYDFQGDYLWDPHISYRYAHFSGDDGGGDNSAFDPLFYGFNDWNEWYVGEIIGEYVSSNRNLETHTFKLSLAPREDIVANLYWIYYELEEFPAEIVPRPPTSPRAALISDDELAHEIEVAIDWSATDEIHVGLMAGVVIPSNGGEDFFGDNENWFVFMLNVGVSF